MKITLRPEGVGDASQDVVLADGADRADDNVRGPAMGSNSVSIRNQPFNAIRARNTRFINRENRAGSYSFRTSRRFATLADAGRFLLTHGMTAPASGTLIFDFGDTSTGGKLAVLYGCAIQQIGQFEQVGITIKANYSVVYGDAGEALPAQLQNLINVYYRYAIYRKINCGGPAVGDWEADSGYFGTSATNQTTTAITGYGDVPQELYQTNRGNELPVAGFHYAVELPAGTYRVKLHFCELVMSEPTLRTFDVSINGTLVLDGYDIRAVADRYAAVVETIETAHSGGDMLIEFAGVAFGPCISGIEIEPNLPET